MGDEQASAEQLVALRAALLELHEAVLDPKPSRRTQRLVRRMQRAHLSWLLVPWYLVELVRSFRFARRRGSMAGEAQASRLYGRLRGKDPHVAQAEVHRMVQQLGWLDERHRWLDDEERPGVPGGANQTELEAAAAALLGYYLAGRRTDDELLAQVQDAWAEYEGLGHEQVQRAVERRVRDRRPEPEVERRAQAAIDRYLVAWRRWLDHRAQLGTAGSPGDGSDG